MKLLRPARLAALSLLAACAVNPATGERQLSLIGEGQEIEMGREADPAIRQQLGVVDNEELQSYVSDLGQRLAAVSERPDLPWKFTVVDDPTVNAFAVPGGFIYVTRGILARFESEAELAGVLGHEIGHVTARHSVNQMSRQQLQQIGLGVGMILSEEVRQVGGLLGAGLQLLNLRYSRGDEIQSDELGLRYMAELGYDPTSMVGVFEMLSQAGQEEGGGRVPEWASTHPYPENRSENIREHIAEEGLPTGGETDRDTYLDHLDGMVFGKDPRQGYFKDTRFVHPELEIDVTFPRGWQTINQPAVVAAIAPSEDGVMTLQFASEEEGTDPEAAIRAFLDQEGVSGGPVRSGSVSGMPATRAPFEASTENGTVRGEVAYIRDGQALFRMMGYAPASAWASHQREVEAAISSFGRLQDPAILAVEPWTLEIRTLSGATSLATYAQRNPSPVELEVLAQINRTTPQDVLDGGRRIKWVTGSPLP